jgi:hypothetical protein
MTALEGIDLEPVKAGAGPQLVGDSLVAFYHMLENIQARAYFKVDLGM